MSRLPLRDSPSAGPPRRARAWRPGTSRWPPRTSAPTGRAPARRPESGAPAAPHAHPFAEA